jgi:hypothetical protein
VKVIMEVKTVVDGVTNGVTTVVLLVLLTGGVVVDDLVGVGVVVVVVGGCVVVVGGSVVVVLGVKVVVVDGAGAPEDTTACRLNMASSLSIPSKKGSAADWETKMASMQDSRTTVRQKE